jgi:hypothetical protein
MLFIAGSFYVAMVMAGYFVEIVFGALGLAPTTRNVQVIEAHISFNYTTVLNIVFLILGAVLVWRFFRTGGRMMLRMMGGPPPGSSEHEPSMQHDHHAM